jgi:ATP-dependent exoDNAse (exonuclease V) beta subunit
VASNRFEELIKANYVARELDFVLHWPPHPHPPFPSPVHGEGGVVVCVIRGVVDCVYEDREGHWHIIDYKTNRLSGRTLADVAGSYELQLRVYALALEQIMGVSPRELVLWFLETGEEYAVTWNASMRQACVDAVNRAIGQMVG